MPFAHGLPGHPGPHRQCPRGHLAVSRPRLALPRLPIVYLSVIDLDPSRLSHLGITNDHGQFKIAKGHDSKRDE
jgi:hypothetical protein